MNFFRLIFLVIIVITFSQKVMSDSHDQNIVEKAKEINSGVGIIKESNENTGGENHHHNEN